MTALHWAAQHGHQGVAETLLKHGADVHALSKFDKTPFDIAVDIQNTELMLLLQVGRWAAGAEGVGSTLQNLIVSC